jgi:hypothetical protein
MDNAQNCDTYINIPSSQTYGHYFQNNYLSVRVREYKLQAKECFPGCTSYTASNGKFNMDGGKGNAMERNETDAGFFFKD